MERLFAILGLLSLAWAKIEVQYFKIGTNIEMRPPDGSPLPPNRILWKHGDNLVAEWSTLNTEVEIYSTFKERTTLNTTTGRLVIRATTKEDAGEYKVEINDKLLDNGYNFVSIEHVPEPHVWLKPGGPPDERILSCEGDVSKAGPVEYYWNIGLAQNEPWIKSADDKFTLINNETTKQVQFVYCKMVNPIGQRESPPHENPFYETGSNVGAIVGGILVVLAVIIIIILGVLGFLFREKIQGRFSPPQNGTTGKDAGTTGKDAIPPEKLTLTEPGEILWSQDVMFCA